MRVFVYRNLHRNCYSVRNVKTGLVVAHVQEAVLVDCKLKVSEAGRQHILRDKKKNVHAGVEGTLCDYPVGAGIQSAGRLRYNPYEGPTFVDEMGRIVQKADVLVLDWQGVHQVIGAYGIDFKIKEKV